MNASFEDKLSKFLKDSDERLTDSRISAARRIPSVAAAARAETDQ